MSALVKMEDLLSSYRVQKELQRVKFPVQWTLSAVPGHCLAREELTCHPRTPTRIKGWDFQSSVPQRHKICLLLCWLGIRFLPELSLGRHMLSKFSHLGLTMSGIATAPTTNPLDTTTHMAPGRGGKVCSMPLPGESHAGRCSHWFGGPFKCRGIRHWCDARLHCSLCIIVFWHWGIWQQGHQGRTEIIGKGSNEGKNARQRENLSSILVSLIF